MASLYELFTDDSEIRKIIVDPELTHAEAARRLKATGKTEVSAEAVRRLRERIAWKRADTDASAPLDGPRELGSGHVTVDANGGEFVNVTVAERIMGNNFDHVFELFNLDPTLYEIVDDTVRMSTWQQSKRLENGERDIVQLYSYSCRFRKVGAAPISEEDFEQRRQRVLDWRPDLTLRRTPGTGLGDPSTLVVNWADWQLGKSEGGGTDATEQRVLDSFEKTVNRFNELRAIGRNVEGIAVVNMGDPTEGCMGNYSNQLFTVDLSQRRQLLLAMDLFETGILNLASLVGRFNAIGVLCNHGEWNRVDGKSATDDSDNASGFLMDATRRVLQHHPDMHHITWNIPRDEMVVMVELSGVQNAFTHGHKIPSGTLKSEEQWLQNQSIYLLRKYGAEPRIWTTAHKHHAFLYDFGPWHRIQCSALDGGSKWYLDSSGKWSAPGTTTYLAGTHDPRGFSDYAVL